MGPKKDNDSSKMKRIMTRIMIKLKKEIIVKHEGGVGVSDLGIQFGLAESTLCVFSKIKRWSREPMLQESNSSY